MSNIHKIGLIILFSVVILTSTSAINHVSGFVQPTFVSKFGRPSYNTNGELNFPSGIAIDNNGNVYVSEVNRISKFDGEGNFLTRWPAMGCEGIDTDNNNNVYVVSNSNTQQKVRKYDSNGTLIVEWGSYGNGNGQFNSPRDVAVNKNLGRIYVMDSGNYRVQIFDLDGNFLNKWGDSSLFGGYLGPFGIAINQATGDVYVANTGQLKVQKFDLNGNFLLGWGTSGKNEGELRWPRGIDVDNNGNVYVADTDNERIQKFDSSGNFIMAVQGLPSISTPSCSPHLSHTDCTTLHNEIDGPFHPRAIAVDPRNGNIFATASYAQRIDKFDSLGSFLKTWGWWEKGNGVLNQPNGMAIDNLNGYIYIADTGNFLIQKFGINGTFITSWGYSARVYAKWTGGDGSFDFPSTLTTDNEGNVYILRSDSYYWGDPELRRMQKFDQNGNFLSSWNHPDFHESMLGILYNPYSHYLYVANTPNNKIQYFTTDGQYISEFGGAGNTDGKFNSPTRIAVDHSNGNIYVVDVNNSRIQKFSSTGVFLTKWGQYGTADGEFKLGTYSGIYVDNNGYVYVVDPGNNRIQVFDSNGNFVLKWGKSGGGNGSFISPQGVVIDSNGFIYVLDSSNTNIQKFTSIYPDADGDGYTSYVDCNDNAPTINPGAIEICDGKDNDCNGVTDDGIASTPTTCGVGECSSTGTLSCQNGSMVNSCTPGQPGTEGPLGDTTCSDGKDNDCDGLTDNADPGCVQVCIPPTTEVCDGVDNDCNGQIDDGVLNAYYQDVDGDGYGNPLASTQACTQPSGYVTNNTDCNDNDPLVNPGATEILCNGKDDDCNPATGDGGVDLYISSISAPSSATAGQTISVSDTTNKSGACSAGASTTKIYFSINGSTYDPSDTLLGSRAVPGFGAGSGSSSGSTSVTIPNSTLAGSYYIIVRADADNAIAEWNEGNNYRAVSISITTNVDLYVSSATAPGSANAGNNISVSDTTNKSGSGVTGTSTTKFYLSTDNKYSSGDTYLGSRAVPGFGAGSGSSSGGTSVTIPLGTPSGSYYLIVRADANNNISEWNEGNNNRASYIQITP